MIMDPTFVNTGAINSSFCGDIQGAVFVDTRLTPGGNNRPLGITIEAISKVADISGSNHTQSVLSLTMLVVQASSGFHTRPDRQVMWIQQHCTNSRFRHDYRRSRM